MNASGVSEKAVSIGNADYNESQIFKFDGIFTLISH